MKDNIKLTVEILKDKLQNKKIAILGLGLENLALVKYILKHKIKCEITICDRREEVKRKWIPAYAGMTKKKEGITKSKIKWQLGKDYNKNLDEFDILFRSPGWTINCPGIVEAQNKKSPLSPFIKGGRMLSSPMKLFFDLCQTKNIIGVTGTKGKGTTASLIYGILKIAGKPAWLGGNIGVAPFAFIDKIKKNDWVVLELSSFQLEDMTVSPRIAVIINFYPEHLAPADPNNPNYHKSLKNYRDAKLNIIKWQKKGDTAVLNYELRIMTRLPDGQDYELNTKSKVIYFKKSELPSKLIGEHNQENIAAAVEVAKLAGVKTEIIKKAVADFKGLEHRLEFVRELNGVKYYDDSFATTPESTIIALKSFTTPIILFLGGADKAASFKKLADEIKKRCKFAVLLKGAATPRIKKELLKVKLGRNKIKLFNNINEAVKFAKKIAVQGDAVLLSTACASFGMFKNYKERGDLFKKQVKDLK